jgi:DNA-binding MarR family transcriptional regulator
MTINTLELSVSVRTKPVREIDVELFTFIERYATSLARWDLLIYFGRNPAVLDPAHEIANRVGRAAATVQKELDDLVYLGVLRAQGDKAGLVYGLVRATATRRAVIRLARDFVP